MSNQEEIRKLIGEWIPQQNEVARMIGMSPPGLNKMLTGASPLPLSRFLQLVVLLRPDQEEIDRVFNLYLSDLDIRDGGLRLLLNGAVTKQGNRARAHELIDLISESKLETIIPILEMMV